MSHCITTHQAPHLQMFLKTSPDKLITTTRHSLFLSLYTPLSPLPSLSPLSSLLSPLPSVCPSPLSFPHNITSLCYLSFDCLSMYILIIYSVCSSYSPNCFPCRLALPSILGLFRPFVCPLHYVHYTQSVLQSGCRGVSVSVSVSVVSCELVTLNNGCPIEV